MNSLISRVNRSATCCRSVALVQEEGIYSVWTGGPNPRYQGSDFQAVTAEVRRFLNEEGVRRVFVDYVDAPRHKLDAANFNFAQFVRQEEPNLELYLISSRHENPSYLYQSFLLPARIKKASRSALMEISEQQETYYGSLVMLFPRKGAGQFLEPEEIRCIHCKELDRQVRDEGQRRIDYLLEGLPGYKGNTSPDGSSSSAEPGASGSDGVSAETRSLVDRARHPWWTSPLASPAIGLYMVSEDSAAHRRFQSLIWRRLRSPDRYWRKSLADLVFDLKQEVRKELDLSEEDFRLLLSSEVGAVELQELNNDRDFTADRQATQLRTGSRATILKGGASRGAERWGAELREELLPFVGHVPRAGADAVGEGLHAAPALRW